MRPLQDQCEPTPYEDVEQLFMSDMGASISDLFDEFDPVPVGVASLAQVHVGRLKATGQKVAVKVGSPLTSSQSYSKYLLHTYHSFNIHTWRNSVISTWKQ